MITVMEERRKFLCQILKRYEKEEAVYERTLEGQHLRVHREGDYVSFYLRRDGQKSGRYLSKKADRDLLQRLAQKDYAQKIVCQAKKELKAIEAFEKKYPQYTAEQVQDQYEKDALALIKPLVTTNDQYAKRWQEEYEIINDFHDFHKENCIYTTKRGEKVRSKSEVIIADALFYEKIPYYYERSVYIDGIGICHPDFTVLNVNTRKEYIWEHFGMMSDMEYAQSSVRKIQEYQKAGYFLGKNFIATYEDAVHPLTPDLIKGVLEEYLL